MTENKFQSIELENQFHQQLIDETITECKKKEIKCREEFGRMYISTLSSEWYFEVPYNPKSKIRLMHSNTHGALGRYHEQFKKEINIRKLINYIYFHDKSKYGKSAI